MGQGELGRDVMGWGGVGWGREGGVGQGWVRGEGWGGAVLGGPSKDGAGQSGWVGALKVAVEGGGKMSNLRPVMHSTDCVCAQRIPPLLLLSRLYAKC